MKESKEALEGVATSRSTDGVDALWEGAEVVGRQKSRTEEDAGEAAKAAARVLQKTNVHLCAHGRRF